jgi:tellurite resistance-related uncharacterized protein
MAVRIHSRRVVRIGKATWRAALALLASAGLGLTAPGTAGAAGLTWHSEHLDGPGAAAPAHTSGGVGTFNATTVFNGQLQVFTYDPGAGSLRHDWWDGHQWHFEWVDGPDSSLPGHTTDRVGQYNAVTVFNGQLHVFTYDATYGGLRHGWWNGSWHFETLDGLTSTKAGHTNDRVGQYNAVTAFNGTLHVFSYDATASSLRHGWWNGSWHFETLNGPASTRAGHSSDDVGQYNAVTAFNGTLHVFSYDATASSLHHGWWNGSWHFETLDGPASTTPGHTNDSVGQDNAVTVFNGTLQLFTSDVQEVQLPALSGLSFSSLRHGWWNNGWHFEILAQGCAYPNCGIDITRSFGFNNVTAIYNGQLHVFSDSTEDSENTRVPTPLPLFDIWWNGRWNGGSLPLRRDAESTTTSLTADDAAVVYSGQIHVFTSLQGLVHLWTS